jgi:hypothetical protein
VQQDHGLALAARGHGVGLELEVDVGARAHLEGRQFEDRVFLPEAFERETVIFLFRFQRFRSSYLCYLELHKEYRYQ